MIRLVFIFADHECFTALKRYDVFVAGQKRNKMMYSNRTDVKSHMRGAVHVSMRRKDLLTRPAPLQYTNSYVRQPFSTLASPIIPHNWIHLNRSVCPPSKDSQLENRHDFSLLTCPANLKLCADAVVGMGKNLSWLQSWVTSEANDCTRFCQAYFDPKAPSTCHDNWFIIFLAVLGANRTCYFGWVSWVVQNAQSRHNIGTPDALELGCLRFYHFVARILQINGSNKV